MLETQEVLPHSMGWFSQHVAMMASWHKAKYFHTFGHRDEVDRRFANGDCAMLTVPRYLLRWRMAIVLKRVSSLPYHDDVYGAPKNTLADGASLWVSGDLKASEVKGVAKFVNYLLGPEVQVDLTLAGGFLPLTPVARVATQSHLLQSSLAGLQVAYHQLQGKTVLPKLRLPRR